MSVAKDLDSSFVAAKSGPHRRDPGLLKPRILVVDDDPVVRRMLQALLLRAGHDPIMIGSGTEAWTALMDEKGPVVALLDWMMPGFSGIEVCRRIRNHERQHYAHLIMLTAKDQPGDIERALSAGADDYIRKPFNPEEVSARVSNGIRLLAAHERLKASSNRALMNQMASGLAHELNNELMVVAAHAEIMANRSMISPAGEKHLAKIRAASERAARFMREVMACSEIQVMSPGLWDLNELVSQERETLRSLIEGKAGLLFEPSSEKLKVLVDPKQFSLALLHLCLNARDAMRDGGTVEMTTSKTHCSSSSSADMYAGVHIRDSGVGIPEEIRSRLFEPFFSTKQKGPSCGLGLAIARGIAIQSGGRIEFTSEVGRGSTFSLLLPMVTGEPPSG